VSGTPPPPPQEGLAEAASAFQGEPTSPAEVSEPATPGPAVPEPAVPEPTAPDPVALVEAYLFAAAGPVEEREIQALLGARAEAASVLAALAARRQACGVRLERSGRHWALRTAPELAPFLQRTVRPLRRLSKAALETLAVIAWRQPVTRAEIEEVRGVSLSAGTLELLVEAGWVAPKGRREAPGRPVAWGTTDTFLDAFGLATLAELPRLEELAADGLFKARPGD
jgi:segregation and condensation protein B